MEVHQLRYFVAVVEHGTFRSAAQHCHVAQPSLSQQIIKLESHLGCKLFDRLGKRNVLTEAGKALLPRARRILAEIDAATRRLASDVEAGRGSLAVGAIPTVAPYILPGAIRSFSRRYPEAKLTVTEDLTDSLLDGLAKVELDLCLLSPPFASRGLETEEIVTEPLLAVLPRDRELVRGGRIYVRDLEELPNVVLSEVHCLGEQISAFCHGSGVERNLLCRTSQLSTVLSLVALGMGVSLVPRMCAAMDRSDSLVYRRLEDASPRRTIVAAWLAGRSRSLLASHFVDAVRKESEEHRQYLSNA